MELTFAAEETRAYANLLMTGTNQPACGLWKTADAWLFEKLPEAVEMEWM